MGFTILTSLGFSRLAITCYEALFDSGPTTARQLSDQLGIPATNLHATLEKLVEEGFVDKSKLTSRPASFKARPLETALPNHYMHQRLMLLSLCRELKVNPPPALPLRWTNDPHSRKFRQWPH